MIEHPFKCPLCAGATHAVFQAVDGGSLAAFKCKACGVSASTMVGLGSPFDPDAREALRSIDSGLALLAHYARHGLKP